jgi:hypothetical protein
MRAITLWEPEIYLLTVHIYAPLALEAQARHRRYSSVQQPGSYDHTATVPGYQKGLMAQSGCLWGRLVARLAPAAVDTPGIGPALPALAAEQARMMAVPVTAVVAVAALQMKSTHYLLVVHR